MAKAAAKSALPKGVLKSDLVRPDYDDADGIDYNLGESGQLTLYKTERFGWVINTLFISRGKRGQPDRSYGQAIDTDQVVSCGNGPHVTETAVVYIRKSRAEALKPLTDMYVEGMKRANAIRDRRSSRIAQGQEMRAQGKRSWSWDV
jgi:hypothetical protein